MSISTMTIGKIAAEAGVNIQTIRYYERTGLVPEPPRRPSGYRAYGADTVRLVRFIKHAQELGFTLAEVEELLRLREDRVSPCAEVRAAAAAKVEAIDWRIRRLRAMKGALRALMACCDSNGSARSCPILETLDGSGPIPVTRVKRTGRSQPGKETDRRTKGTNHG